MSIPNETVMAYVDGELDGAACAEVEAAMRDDPELARRVAQHRALRARIESAYSAALAEPVPERLLAPLRATARTGESKVVDLQRARAAIEHLRPSRSAPRWRYTASIAASLLIAVAAGFLVGHRPRSVVIRSVDGSLMADAALAEGLSNQLAGDATPGARVAIGLSFPAKSGDICRTFTLLQGEKSAGLACHHGNGWQIRALTQSQGGPDGTPEYRTASSGLPPVILAAVEAERAGDPLDRPAEIAARDRGWRRPAKE